MTAFAAELGQMQVDMPRPEEAFEHFRERGVSEVVCEEKHMGSRAVVVVCRDEGAVRERFGVIDGEIGIVTTRTGNFTALPESPRGNPFPSQRS